MYFIPLDKPETVAAVLYIMRHGMDCSGCPLAVSCDFTKQSLCQTISYKLEGQLVAGTFPYEPTAGAVKQDNPYQDVLDYLQVAQPAEAGNESVPLPVAAKVPPPPPEPPPVRVIVEGSVPTPHRATEESKRRFKFLGLTIIKGGKE